MESREILTMRQMALERAKGEMKCVMQTFWEADPEFPDRPSPEYVKARNCINKFLEEIYEILG